MTRAAVSVPLEPNLAPVNASIAAPMLTSPKGAGVGSSPTYFHPVSAENLVADSVGYRRVLCQRIGEVGGCFVGIRFILCEHVTNDVGTFKPDGELLPRHLCDTNQERMGRAASTLR